MQSQQASSRAGGGAWDGDAGCHLSWLSNSIVGGEIEFSVVSEVDISQAGGGGWGWSGDTASSTLPSPVLEAFPV